MKGVKGTWGQDFTHGSSGYTNYRCRCEICREGWRQRHLDYMHRHPEQIKKQTKREKVRRNTDPEYRKRQSDMARDRKRERYATDPAFREQVKGRQRDYYAKNPERMRAQRRARYAKSKNYTVRSYTKSVSSNGREAG